jgi:hypothetical protein
MRHISGGLVHAITYQNKGLIGGETMDNRVTDNNQILNTRPPELKEDFGISTDNDEFAKGIMPEETELNNKETDEKEKRP